MTIIIAHIDGPSGSGKSTLGVKINKLYPHIKNIDLDDVRSNLPSLFPAKYLKYDPDLFEYKYFEKGVERFIKPYKYVVLVGGARTTYKSKVKQTTFLTENKFYISIDEETLMKQRFSRHLQFMKDNINKYYEKAKIKPLCIDFDRWKKEKLYYNQSREEAVKSCNDLGYQILDSSTIFDKLEELIKSL